MPGSPEWQLLRRSGLGATDAAVVIGRSRFASPFDKYQEMLGTRAPILETEPMLWGRILERPVGLAWAERTGRKVRHDGNTYWLEDGIFSHYDFNVVGEHAVLEVKTASAYGQREWGEEDTDQVPTEYLLQAQHEIMCRPGTERCYIAVLIGGNRLRKYVVERDDELIGHILTIERRFLERARAGIPPDIDGSEAASEYLRLRDPSDDGSQIELGTDVEDIAREYLAAKAQEKETAEKIALLGNTLRDRLAAASVAVGREVRVTYRQNKPTRVTDWKALAKAVPSSVIDAHTTEKPGARPLIVSWIGE